MPRLRIPDSAYGWGLVCVFIVLAFLGGCSAGNNRQRVTGVVTVDGAPLELGAINFMPAEGLAASSSGATVRDGKFEIPASNGLSPGRYKVDVLAYRETGRTREEPQIGEYPELEELKFEETSLEAVVEEDGPNHFEFALTLSSAA